MSLLNLEKALGPMLPSVIILDITEKFNIRPLLWTGQNYIVARKNNFTLAVGC